MLEAHGLGERAHPDRVEVGLVITDRAPVGEEDEAVEGGRLALPERAAKSESVQLGHADVADDDVVGAAVDQFQRLAAIGGGVHLSTRRP